jgi:DNA-binding MarR family transcriptional regulator
MDATHEQRIEYPPPLYRLARLVGLHIVRSSQFLVPHMHQEILTQSQAFVLDLLLDDQPRCISDLASASGVRIPSVTDLVSRMERQGWIHKTGATHDRRSTMVTITEQGRGVIQAFERRQVALIAERLTQLSEEERALIEQALPALQHLFHQ